MSLRFIFRKATARIISAIDFKDLILAILMKKISLIKLKTLKLKIIMIQLTWK